MKQSKNIQIETDTIFSVH